METTPSVEEQKDRIPQQRSSGQDVQAEMDVLRAMLRWAGHRESAVAELQSGAFAMPHHAALFDVLSTAHSTGATVSTGTLLNDLVENELLEECGGEAAVRRIIEQKASQSAASAITAVREASVGRHLNQVAQRILDGLSEGVTPTQLAESVAALLAGAPFRSPGDRDVSDMHELLTGALTEIEAMGAGEQPASGMVIPTGFADLDRLLNGLHPGQLIVIGGAPNIGKSILALDILRHCALHNGIPAAIFTRQLRKVDVTTLMLSAETRVPNHVLRSGGLNDDDWTRLARRMGEIRTAGLFIEDQTSSIEELRVKALRLKRNDGIGLIVVDSIQRFYPGRWDRYREAADITRVLKDLAMELQVPVVAVSSINRDHKLRSDHRPELWDLRDSGTAEEDADVVILVHRDDHYDKESERAGEAEFIVAKHRLGATDVITVAAQLHLSRFVDMAL